MKIASLGVAAALCLIASAQSWAGVITINNGDFQTPGSPANPVPGWDVAPPGGVTQVSGNGGSVAHTSSLGSISQMTSTAGTAGTKFTFDFEVSGTGTYFAQIFDGTTLIATTAGPATATYEEVSFNGIGQSNGAGNISIVLTGFGDISFDNVTGLATVPEPATAALWGIGAIGMCVVGYRKRKALRTN